MIQRIQSIFLLLAAIASFGLFKLPFGSSEKAIATSQFLDDKVLNVQDHPAFLGFFIGAGVLALIAIFLFNNRSLQLKVSRVSIVANIVGIIVAAFLIMKDFTNLGNVEPTEDLGLGLPIFSIIFAGLGIYFINKDEKLVKSMDRLR